MHSSNTKWVNLGRDNPAPTDLSRAIPGLSGVMRQCLHNRRVTAHTVRDFLSPPPENHLDPSLLTGLDVAVARIVRARRDKERVVVYGDADVDGIAATVLLVEAMITVGLQASPYIPNRLTEHSGLNSQALETIAEQGARLVVTVDCGISDAGEIEAFRHTGIDVIVTDHHAAPPALPPALAVIDPMQLGCRYPFKDLAGVGVAFRLAEGLFRAVGAGTASTRSLLDLVAIGTIADMVPLVGENRTLVWQGLRVLTRATRPGVRALVEKAELQLEAITATDVATRICPRINGAGRMGGESLGYLLLATTSPEDARGYAELSCSRVVERQSVANRALDDCLLRLEQHPSLPGDPLVVANIEPWAASVSGIVAGKLALETGKSVLVLRDQGNEVRGTLRGVPSAALLDALAESRQILSRYGGHQQAAGFSVRRENLGPLVEQLRDALLRRGPSIPTAPRLEIDAELQLQQVNWQLFEQLQQLEPCGIGNPRPTFLCRRLRVIESRIVGNGNLLIVVQSGGKKMPAIAFRRGDLAEVVSSVSEIDLIFSIDVNDWRDSRTLQLQIVDIGFGDYR